MVAYLFPGLNALLRRTDRHRFTHLPEVQSYFSRAEKVILERFGQKISFTEFLELPTEQVYSLKNISIAAVAICCIQVGVAEKLREKMGDPHWVMGCSLGDLARAVFVGCYTFEDLVYNHLRFTGHIDGIDSIGRNIGVLAPHLAPFEFNDYQWFEDQGVDVSILTPRFLNISGRFDDLAKVEKRAEDKNWNIINILNYPVHSRYILPYVLAVKSEFNLVETKAPRIPIFSSVSARAISETEIIKEEFLLCITQAVQWSKAIQSLVHDKGISKFVNIGPCRSLTGLMRDIPVEVETVEAYQLL
ncbi:acyltransferase domain-containing protein [Bdellovibrio reynosensis]|uniref:[acyl-carrier-protein] S-malonyltransferase n=1 Tax=Bdellovibrio reynosensis TaxID=2835041 RepID=A0ABY4C9D7_9BACT|nr:acyltransferase domain-containing protein [Bdellovibrio reynosensis]UOF01344.1 acyltransferase domain-containing protein [Bdellovibrio reynosensis]